MEAIIVNYRRGRKTQKTNQMIIVPEKEGKDLVGKNVVYTTEAKREIKGTISAKHGNKNAYRVIFEKGMPGQAIGKRLKIE